VRASSRKPLDLPVTEGDIRRIEGAARLWDELPPEARERLRRDGVLVLGSELGIADGSADAQKRNASIGAFYTHLREQRMPQIITLDALFSVVHLGLVQALAQAEDAVLAPALHALLEKLDARLSALSAEDAAAGTELLEPYRIARGVVCVARALAATSPYSPPPELAAAVAGERRLVEAHAGVATSPLLGVTIDYTRFAVPSSAARPGAFRALAWLGAAPLTLVARTEVSGSPIGVAQARTNARAAMLLARACDRDVDAGVNAAYTRILRLLTFVWGPSDDLSLAELDDIAESAGIDLTKPADIANVARVDKVRARAIAGRSPAIHDGAGGVGRSGVNVRVFGGHAPADSVVLHSLVGTAAGLAHESASASSIDRLRKGRRVLPSTLDVAAWLGAPEARALLSESNADAFDGYDAALAALHRTRASLEQGALHGSIHGSLVDALIAWANTSPATGVTRTPAADRMRVESLLSAWTLARHVGQAMARSRPAPPAPATELRISGAPLPMFVEPAPEVIARLVCVVRQIRRGLNAVGSLASSSGAMATLVEIEDILRTALASAQRHASDEPASAEEATALASLPARIARLEDEASEEVGPVIATVYADPPTHRVLASATGKIEPALVLTRDPVNDEPLLVVGAHLPHHEIVEAFDRGAGRDKGGLHGVPASLTDVSWRARLQDGVATPAPSNGADISRDATRGSWVSAFRWVR
jgi:hypothetical protein